MPGINLEERLNAALHSKMAEEQHSFRSWLLHQPPEEILNHTHEYTVREDIVMAIEGFTLPEEQAAALLESPSPLADIYKDFRNMDTDHMENVRSSIEGRAEKLLETRRETVHVVPFYQQSGKYAREYGELDAFRASRKANEACCDAIEAVIREIRNEQDFLPATKSILKEFGPERVACVLAAAVRDRTEDQRFSRGNQMWAASVPMFESRDSRTHYMIGSHSTLLDAFVSRMREELDKIPEQTQKPSMHDYDEAKLVSSHTLGPDAVLYAGDFLRESVQGCVHEYQVSGETCFYLDPLSVPASMMGIYSNGILQADLVHGRPLLPVSLKWLENDIPEMTLKTGALAFSREQNAGYEIIAKVRVGPVEYALGELEGKFPSFVTWERTPATDGDGPPNYYWGHYFEERGAAIQDFCGRAAEKFEMLSEQRKPSIKERLAVNLTHDSQTPSRKPKDREAR